MRRFMASLAGAATAVVVNSPAVLAADAHIAVARVEPVRWIHPSPPAVYHPGYAWTYVAPAPVVAARRCYRSRRVHPNGTVVYRRVCV